MLGQTAPIRHTRDGLPFKGMITPNTPRTEAAQKIFQPVREVEKIEKMPDKIKNEKDKSYKFLREANQLRIAKDKKPLTFLRKPPQSTAEMVKII